MKARRPTKTQPTPADAAIDTLYGLEPVFEPDADDATRDDATPYVTVECPYCGEPFETRLDLTHGSTDYIEDCQICCQPIEFDVDVDAAGRLESLRLRRGD